MFFCCWRLSKAGIRPELCVGRAICVSLLSLVWTVTVTSGVATTMRGRDGGRKQRTNPAAGAGG